MVVGPVVVVELVVEFLVEMEHLVAERNGFDVEILEALVIFMNDLIHALVHEPL